MEKKEAYTAPELTVYGPVEEITELLGSQVADLLGSGDTVQPDGGSPVRIIIRPLI